MERKKKQTYCLVCRDYTKSINPKALGILSNLGVKTPLSQVPLLNTLF